MMIRILPLMLLIVFHASAQESLDAVLERGFIKHWLVCGPFPSEDESASILERVRGGSFVLGERDFMQPLGGIERVRPRHRQVVSNPGLPDALWQRAGADSPRLDLAPFFPEAPEGVSYAGFYTESAAEANVYLELHTPLGARAWLNGQPLKLTQEPSLGVAGVNRLVTSFRQGSNFFVIQTPGAALAPLAEALGVSAQELTSRTLANRTLLSGESGFEIALTLRPAAALGELYYVPRLEPTGGFSGSQSDPRQEMGLTLFNPGIVRSAAVDLLVKSRNLVEPMLVQVPGVPPEDRYVAVLPLPIGRIPAGSSTNASVTLLHNGGTATFDATFNVLPRWAGGEVLLLTGTRFLPASEASLGGKLRRKADSLHRQLELAEVAPTYGFEIGPVSEWDAWLSLYPQDLPRLRALVGQGQVDGAAQYARVDERVLNSATMESNLGNGVNALRQRLGGTGFYDAWRTRGIARGTIDLLASAGINGAISQWQQSGIPPLGRLLGKRGEWVWLRHFAPGEGATSFDNLRASVQRQIQELSLLGLDKHLMLLENALDPPEPFMADATPALLASNPSIRVTGDAVSRFLDWLEGAALPSIPAVSHDLLRSNIGELLRSPSLLDAYRGVLSQLEGVEALAAFAAMEGAHFPYAALDHAHRVLAWYSQPDYLASAPGEPAHADTLMSMGRVWEELRAAEDRALLHLANRYEARPVELPEGLEPLATLLFLATGGEDGTRILECALPIPEGRDVAAFDKAGSRLPLLLGDKVAAARPLTRPGALRVIRVAVPVTAWGLGEVLFALETAPEPKPRGDLLIQNDAWLVQADPQTGSIIELRDKRSGVNHAKGAMNALVALPLEAGNAMSLWTAGESSISLGAPESVETRAMEGVQELRIVSRLGSARVSRTVRLWQGLDRVDFDCHVKDAAESASLLLLSVGVNSEGRTVFAGERDGAIALPINGAKHTYQEDLRRRTSPLGLRPAHDWVGALPGPHVRFGLDRVIPLRPAIVVHPDDAAGRDAAESLQIALAGVSIPSIAYPSSPRGPGSVWTDGTVLRDAITEYQRHGGMFILLGNTENNWLIREAVEGLDETDKTRYAATSARGSVFAVPLTLPDPMQGQADAILLGGADATATRTVVEDFGESLSTFGYHTLPAEAALGGIAPGPLVEDGLAILFEGMRVVAHEPDGSISILIGQSGKEEDQRFSFSILPVSGESSFATISSASMERRPLLARETVERGKGLSAEHRFLSAEPTGVSIQAVRPYGYPLAAKRSPDFAADGLAVRLMNASNRAWTGSLSLANGAIALGEGSYLGDAPPASTAGVLTVPAGQGVTAWVLGRPRATAADATPPSGPMFSAYPLHGWAIPPLGDIPVRLRLAVDWSNPDASEIHVSNPSTDLSVAGEIYLETPESWSVGPSVLPFQVSPGEAISLPFALRTTGRDPGAVLALASVGERVVYDCIREDSSWLELSKRHEDDRFVVSIFNRMGVRALGEITLGLSPRFWDGWRLAPASEVVSPMGIAFDLPPTARREFTFRAAGGGKFPKEGHMRISANGSYEVLPL